MIVLEEVICACRGGGALASACNCDEFWEEGVESLEYGAGGISCWAEEVGD